MSAVPQAATDSKPKRTTSDERRKTMALADHIIGKLCERLPDTEDRKVLKAVAVKIMRGRRPETLGLVAFFNREDGARNILIELAAEVLVAEALGEPLNLAAIETSPVSNLPEPVSIMKMPPVKPASKRSPRQSLEASPQ